MSKSSSNELSLAQSIEEELSRAKGIYASAIQELSVLLGSPLHKVCESPGGEKILSDLFERRSMVRQIIALEERLIDQVREIESGQSKLLVGSPGLTQKLINRRLETLKEMTKSMPQLSEMLDLGQDHFYSPDMPDVRAVWAFERVSRLETALREAKFYMA